MDFVQHVPNPLEKQWWLTTPGARRPKVPPTRCASCLGGAGHGFRVSLKPGSEIQWVSGSKAVMELSGPDRPHNLSLRELPHVLGLVGAGQTRSDP